MEIDNTHNDPAVASRNIESHPAFDLVNGRQRMTTSLEDSQELNTWLGRPFIQGDLNSVNTQLPPLQFVDKDNVVKRMSNSASEGSVVQEKDEDRGSKRFVKRTLRRDVNKAEKKEGEAKGRQPAMDGDVNKQHKKDRLQRVLERKKEGQGKKCTMPGLSGGDQGRKSPLPEHKSEVGDKTDSASAGSARRGQRAGKKVKNRVAESVKALADAVADNKAQLQAEKDVRQDAEREKAEAIEAEKQAIAQEKKRLGDWWNDVDIRDEDVRFVDSKMAALSRFDKGQVKQFILATANRDEVSRWNVLDLANKIALSRVLDESVAEPEFEIIPPQSRLSLMGGICGGIAGALLARVVSDGATPTAISTSVGTYLGSHTAVKYFTPQDFKTVRLRWLPVKENFDLDALRSNYATSNLFTRTFLDFQNETTHLANYLLQQEHYAPKIVPTSVCHGNQDATMPLRRSFVAKQRYISYRETTRVSSSGRYSTVDIRSVSVHDVDIALIFDCLKPKLIQCRTGADINAAVRSLLAANLHTGPNLISNWTNEFPIISGTFSFLREIALCNLHADEVSNLN